MRKSAGFTLIELLMVVLIVGVLASVVVPAYTAQRDSAELASAHSDLEVVLRTARALHARNDGVYPDAAAIASAAQSDHPSLTVAAGSAFGPTVEVRVPSAGRVELRRQATRQRTNAMIVDDRTPGSQQTARLHGYRGDAAGLPAVTNELLDPGVESGTTTYMRGLGPSVPSFSFSVASSGCRAGRHCAQINTTGSTPGAYFGWFPIQCVTCNLAPTSPGDRAGVRCSARVISGTVSNIRLSANMYAADGTRLTAYPVDQIDDPQPGRWYDLGGVTGPMPDPSATASTARVNFGGLEGDAVLQTDRCMIVVNPPDDRLPAYFDGRTGGGRWTGTADASRSDGYLARRTTHDD